MLVISVTDISPRAKFSSLTETGSLSRGRRWGVLSSTILSCLRDSSMPDASRRMPILPHTSYLIPHTLFFALSSVPCALLHFTDYRLPNTDYHFLHPAPCSILPITDYRIPITIFCTLRPAPFPHTSYPIPHTPYPIPHTPIPHTPYLIPHTAYHISFLVFDRVFVLICE
jgi:hypothetical protein